VPEIPLLDDISGLTTLEMTLQGSGGAGGDGGEIVLNSDGNIRTAGDFAMGVVAQSVAGGGGLAGLFNPHGIIHNEIGDALFNSFVDTDAGLSFAGSVGGAGSAGKVTVSHTGDIVTQGDGAHGLFAQSAAGQGTAGDVDISLNGSIFALGESAHAVYAQSGGSSGNGDISVQIGSGDVVGGSGAGAGVFISEGAENELVNYGSISSADGISGRAIIAGSGNETVSNFGTVSGNILLGNGVNAVRNKRGATLNAGTSIDLGADNRLDNAGTLSPGGKGSILTTTVTGDLQQTNSGILALDIDSSNGAGDRLDVSGTADLAGTAELNIINAGQAVPGSHQTLILTGAGGTTDSGLSLAYQPSTVLSYQLLYPNATDVVLNTQIDFSPSQTLSSNQGTIGRIINLIQSSGGSESLAPAVEALTGLPDSKAIGEAYNNMSPESTDGFGATTFEAAQQYAQTLVKRMHSIRAYLDVAKIAPGSKQTLPNSFWIKGFGETADQDAGPDFTGFDYELAGLGIGLDKLFKDGILAGISYGQTYTSLDLDKNRGDGSIHSYLFSLYGSLFSDRYYLDATFSYGKESFRDSRLIEIGALSEVAYSDHDGDLFSIYAETGYLFQLNAWLPQPFIALQYSILDEESYRETGAGGLNLLVEQKDTESLVSDLGLRFNRPFKKNEWVYIPEISVAWRHDYDIDNRRITAAFEGAPDVLFTTESRDLDQDGVLIGAGVTALNKESLSLDIRYDTELRGDFTSQRIAGGIRYEF